MPTDREAAFPHPLHPADPRARWREALRAAEFRCWIAHFPAGGRDAAEETARAVERALAEVAQEFTAGNAREP